MWDLYLYISFYNIWKFGCLLWCWSINEQGSQKPEKKKCLLEILKSKPEVIGFSTWSHIPVPPTTSALSQLNVVCAFLLLPTQSNLQWLKMAAEVLLQHINFSLSGPILSSERWKSSFCYFPLPPGQIMGDSSNLGLPSHKPKHNIFSTIFRLSLIAVRIMRFLPSTLHPEQTS